MPGVWETKSEKALNRVIILRSFLETRQFGYLALFRRRNEAIRVHAVKCAFIYEIFEIYNNVQPVIFVLTKVVEPTKTLLRFAKGTGIKLDTLSLSKI